MNKLYRDRLKQFRLSRKTRNTQMDFSEDLDINTHYYSRVEIGQSNPSVPLHIKICKELQKPSDCFFCENKPDFSLSEDQINYLKTLDKDQLELIMLLLQDIYEHSK